MNAVSAKWHESGATLTVDGELVEHPCSMLVLLKMPSQLAIFVESTQKSDEDGGR